MENSIRNKKPDLALEFHTSKNGKKTIDNISAGSNKNVWWQCKTNKLHSWQASPYNRGRKNGGGCPYCSNRKLCPEGTNSLETLFPEIAKLWHKKKNSPLNPREVVGGGTKKYWWKCPKGQDHEWEQSVHQIVQNKRKSKNKVSNGCPVCSGDKVVKSNCLETTNPELAKEWGPNNNISVNEVTPYSNKKVEWQCLIVDRHKWKATINNRNSGDIGCPYCHKIIQKSHEELVLLFELKFFWPEIPEEGFYVKRNKTKKTVKNWDVDIYIPSLNIGIEYDGEYYHSKPSKRKTDIDKTKDLEGKGMTVIHVLEGNLPFVNQKNDVQFGDKFRGKAKKLADAVLNKIIELKGEMLNHKTKQSIQKYFNCDKLKNEDEREKFRTNHLLEVIGKREKKKFLNSIKIEYWEYKKALQFAQSKKLNSQTEWKKFVKNNKKNPNILPPEVPRDPYSYYKKNGGWESWKVWLDKKEITYLPFEEAREIMRSNNLKNIKEYRAFKKNNPEFFPKNNIPKTPEKVYKNSGWISEKDWLRKA